MFKPLLAGAAAIALTMGMAYGQTTVETTTTRTTTVAPPPAPLPPPVGYNTTRTERTTFGGAATEVDKTYRSDANGVTTTNGQKIVHPDGTVETVTHQQDWAQPAPPPSPPPVGTISTTTTRTYR